jgi:hypothetical protein
MSLFKTLGRRHTFGFDRIFTTSLPTKGAACHKANDEAPLTSKSDKSDKVEKARDKIKVEDKKTKVKSEKRKNTYDAPKLKENVGKRMRVDNKADFKKKDKRNLDVFAELFDTNSQDEQ